jgi:hypothetical protein
MITYSLPNRIPEDRTGRKFSRPSMIPRPDGAPTSWLISASKKVDDISRHESNYDPKKDPKPGAMQDPHPQHPDVVNPGINHREGGKPTGGGHRK